MQALPNISALPCRLRRPTLLPCTSSKSRFVHFCERKGNGTQRARVGRVFRRETESVMSRRRRKRIEQVFHGYAGGKFVLIRKITHSKINGRGRPAVRERYGRIFRSARVHGNTRAYEFEIGTVIIKSVRSVEYVIRRGGRSRAGNVTAQINGSERPSHSRA